MNPLPWLMCGPRGSGRTTVIAEACRSIDATMLCFSRQEADRIHRQHGIKTVDINMRGEGMAQGPFLADHKTMEEICHNYESQLIVLRIEITMLRKANGTLKNRNKRLSKQEQE